MIKRYLVNLLIALDQAVNALTGGDPDETISSRFGKRSSSNLIRRAIDRFFFWQPDHTKNSIEPDEGKDSVSK